MSQQEKLHFKIGLSGSKSNKKPEFAILVNNKEFVHQKIQSDEIEYFEFSCIVDEGESSLVISLLNMIENDKLASIECISTPFSKESIKSSSPE